MPTPLRCNLSYQKIDSHIIIVNFISESDLSMYGLGQNFIRWKLRGVGTLVKIRLHTDGRWTREHNPKKLKQDYKLLNTRNIT